MRPPWPDGHELDVPTGLKLPSEPPVYAATRAPPAVPQVSIAYLPEVAGVHEYQTEDDGEFGSPDSAVASVVVPAVVLGAAAGSVSRLAKLSLAGGFDEASLSSNDPEPRIVVPPTAILYVVPAVPVKLTDCPPVQSVLVPTRVSELTAEPV